MAAKKKKNNNSYIEKMLCSYRGNEWSSTKLKEAAAEIAKEFNVGFIHILKNYDSANFKGYELPGDGTRTNIKVAILWPTPPINPADILSWRCGLVERGGYTYKFIFLPDEDNNDDFDWSEWLAGQLGDWVQPEADREDVGLQKGDKVQYRQNGCVNMGNYEPAFLTISPTGKMEKVLGALDECRKFFMEVMGNNIRARREAVHNLLDDLLTANSCSVPGDSSLVQNVGEKIKDLFSQSAFNADRNSLPKIMLLGPSGVGKTLVARYLAWLASSSYPSETYRPFKRIPIPAYLGRESEFETDVFGFCAGSYTGAPNIGSKGYLLERWGGVVFFDEIGDASPAIQAKLLAYLDDYEVTPRGWHAEPASLFCPMLVVAATNLPIDEWAAQDLHRDSSTHFRNDLLRRFNYIIKIPSLEDRKDELPFILDVVLQMDAFNPGGKVKQIGVKALKQLTDRDFSKGNFRELETILRNACYRAIQADRDYMVEADVRF